MHAFTYERASSGADAAARAAAGAKLLAGGQTLLASMKQRLSDPGRLVDLGGIGELVGIRRTGAALVIGAMTTHLAVTDSALVQSAIPALADLAAHIGDRQVRAMGTLGGSVANNDPAACYPSALLALGATVQTSGRQIAADDFFLGMFATALFEGELITAVSFPIPKRALYLKFKQPASRFALVGVFVAELDAGVRVAVTGAGTGVFRHTALEAALDREFSAGSAAAVPIASAELNSDIHASAAYRANLISVLTQRAVAQLVAQAAG